MSLREIVERLDPAQFEMVVVAPTPGPFVDDMRRLGVPCYWGLAQRWIFFDKPLRPNSKTALLRKLVAHPYLWATLSWLTMPLRVTLLALFSRAKGARLIYSNTATVLDGALAARLLRLPHVWHLREDIEGNSDLRFPGPVSWFPSFVLRMSAIAIVNSQRLGRDLFGAALDDRVRVVWNGIDLDALDRQLSPSPPLAIPATARLTAICGRLTKRKGIDVYLLAMHHLKDSHPDLHHLVIGEGSEAVTRELISIADELGLGGRVWFIGHREDVMALFSRVDVVVSASLREPFGRTLIEAMACEVPVVATRSGGPEEIVVEGENGFLVDVGDDVALAERVAKLLDDRALAAALGAAGRVAVTKQFTLERTVAGVVDGFEQALRMGRDVR
jgi:glycosyltransferase involved in cell wall biosynthesis